MRSPVAARTLNRHPDLSPPKKRGARPGIKCVIFRHRFAAQRSAAMLTRRSKCFSKNRTTFGSGKCVLSNRVCRRFGRTLRSKPYLCRGGLRQEASILAPFAVHRDARPVVQQSGSPGASIIWIGSLSSYCFAHATLRAHVNNTQQ
jgi:hypothetical protein